MGVNSLGLGDLSPQHFETPLKNNECPYLCTPARAPALDTPQHKRIFSNILQYTVHTGTVHVYHKDINI